MTSSLEIDDDATLDVGKGDDAPTAPAQPVSSPPHPVIKRYVVLEQVGAGGMGVVHRAYDPRLRREVAIKMLRFDRQDGGRAVTRILREARTMAQLSHPNVLPVYDVEPVGALVYIAMEFVDGETLGRWLRRKGHSWREVVDVFRQAGEGLHAAHQAGIVHRDFKPANVMMGNKGRVLVTDFGLARAYDHDEPEAHGSAGPVETSVEVTADGELVGTPAYMPPEQLRGESVDARADQYSFCLALYEGLFGHRPFLEKEHRRLLHVKQIGRIQADPEANVPGWLFRIVERGMSPVPAERFASMEELLQALDHDPAQARRRWAWVGGGIVLGAGLIGLGMATESGGVPGCPEIPTLVSEVWTAEAHERLHDAMLATSMSYAADTASRATAGLDRYAQAWAKGYVDACEATHVRGEQSTEALDLRMACLRRHRVELEATIEILSTDVNMATVREAAAMVADLPDPAACADVEALLARGRPHNPAHAAKLEQLRDDLARATALSRAGRTVEAGPILEAIEHQAIVIDDPLVRGEARLLRGSTAVRERNLVDAERWLIAAHADGVEGRDAPLVLRSSIELVQLVGGQLARTAEAELWATQARAWLRGRNDEDRLATELLMVEGNVQRIAGRFEQAQAIFTQVIERMEHQTATGDLAGAHRMLGMALVALGKPGEAERHFTRELTLLEARLGPSHPQVAAAHKSLGVTLYTSGQLTRALPHFEDAVRIYEGALGPTHPRVAGALGNLGALRDDLGEPEEAREHFERALQILESTGTTGSPELVGMLGNLAQVLRHAGEPAEAAKHLRRAIDLVETSYEPDHPDRVDLLTRLGETLMEAGELVQAREALVQADALRRSLPADAALVSADAARALARLLHQDGEHAGALSLSTEAIELYRSLGAMLDPRRGETLVDLGEIQLATNDPLAARASLEQALPLLATPQLPSDRLAMARYALARALVADTATSDDRTRARELAHNALAGLPADDPRRAEVSAWLGALTQ